MDLDTKIGVWSNLLKDIIIELVVMCGLLSDAEDVAFLCVDLIPLPSAHFSRFVRSSCRMVWSACDRISR